MHKQIAEQFEELGVEPQEDVLDKCVELCLSYNINDPVEFVEQWMAFSVSNLNGAEPTIAYLLDMERKELANKRDKEQVNNRKKRSQISNFEPNPINVYGNEQSLVPTNSNDTDIMDSYLYATPKGSKVAVARTPARQNENLFSPNKVCGTPRNQSENSGKIVYTFGNTHLVKSASWMSSKKKDIRIRQISTNSGEPMSSKSKFLYDSLIEKAQIVGDRVFDIGQRICRKVFGNESNDYELQNVDFHFRDTYKTVGTICSDCDGRLEPSSTILIGSDEMRCRTVRLNFSSTKSFSVFPGQVVMVSGKNPRGDTLMVEEITSDPGLIPPTPPKLEEELSFVVASGPFTNYDDLVYDPLHDLILYCKDSKPDVLFLIGPFMDAEHTLIHENVVLEDSFEMYFEKMLAGIVEALGPNTTICIVSSYKDANAEPIFPTPPLTLKKSYPNVHLLPDPSIIDLNGVSIGITSTDIISHLLDFELAVNSGDKVKRAVNHLFQQSSFYPLHPPDDRMCFDSNLANTFAKIESIPNVMILPSDQKCFIRDVNNCLAINPGRITDKSGGTFARFIIHPGHEEYTGLLNNVACQVIKI